VHLINISQKLIRIVKARKFALDFIPEVAGLNRGVFLDALGGDKRNIKRVISGSLLIFSFLRGVAAAYLVHIALYFVRGSFLAACQSVSDTPFKHHL